MSSPVRHLIPKLYFASDEAFIKLKQTLREKTIFCVALESKRRPTASCQNARR